MKEKHGKNMFEDMSESEANLEQIGAMEEIKFC